MLTLQKQRPSKNDLLLKMLEKLRASMGWQAFIEGLFLTFILWLHPSMSSSRNMYLLIEMKNKSLLLNNQKKDSPMQPLLPY